MTDEHMGPHPNRAWTIAVEQLAIEEQLDPVGVGAATVEAMDFNFNDS